MSRSARRIAGVLILLAISSTVCAQQSGYAGVGRDALPEEIEAWNIDVRPDFAGLPPGSGSVARGQVIWEQQCAACHGFFGESTEVYRPIVGGTTAEDMRSGRAATLASGAPLVTTLSKLSTVSTLWDYIRRAMPWTTPKSLRSEEVYAVVAYILHLGDIVPAEFVLSDVNIEAVQRMLPNRLGAVPHEGLWNLRGEPDVRNVACMKNCPTRAEITSEFPSRALAAHGSPAEQNRPWGAIRGVTLGQEARSEEKPAGVARPAKQEPSPQHLAQSAGCLACHGIERAIVGPALVEIAARYKGDEQAAARLFEAVKSGGSGVWGTVAMPPQQIDDEALRTIIEWVLDGPQAR